MRFPGFVGPSYQARSVIIDCQRTINFFPEFHELGNGKEADVGALVPTPGLRLLVDLGDGPIRGSYRSSTNRLFVVSGNKFYEVSSSWVGTEKGTLNTSTGKVSMADNGIELVLVDGTDGFYMTLATDVFAELIDPDFYPADHVQYIDGYFLFNRTDTGQFFITNLNSVVIDALDIATSEGSPDKLIGILADHRQLWAFNKDTIEVYNNTGAEFPFERIEGAFIEHGCAAKHSMAKLDSAVFWLGHNEKGHGVVYRAQGYQPQKISTTPIDIAIQGYSDIEDATAYTYQQDGHGFYVLNFPSANTTWVFDTSTNLWHERAYFSSGSLGRHRADSHAFAFNTHVVGDYENGNLYALDNDYHYDDVSGAQTILRRRVLPYVSGSLARVFHQSIELDAEVGVGDGTEGQGSDPQVSMQFSDDGGRTWSNEQWRSMGKIGETKTRMIWRRLGASRSRAYRFTVTDPVKVIFLGAEIVVERGAH